MSIRSSFLILVNLEVARRLLWRLLVLVGDEESVGRMLIVSCFLGAATMAIAGYRQYSPCGLNTRHGNGLDLGLFH
jgi:hypothetical protein